MKKGDVGMVKHFYKKYGNKGWAFDDPVSATFLKIVQCNVDVIIKYEVKSIKTLEDMIS